MSGGKEEEKKEVTGSKMSEGKAKLELKYEDDDDDDPSLFISLLFSWVVCWLRSDSFPGQSERGMHTLLFGFS